MNWDVQFIEPGYLRLLVVPATALLLLIWRVVVRRSEIVRYQKNRIIPVSEKYLFFGRLLFWLMVIFAFAISIVALSRPAKIISVKNDTAIDLIILQDGSASMRVEDIKPDRWQRSMMFLRTLTETLEWKGDRLGLASFARLTSPFIRFTSDPNVVLFFLDHLKKEPPFKLADNKTWDTNIADSIRWGLKLISKDRETYGPSQNPQALVLISDGQAWSGKLEEAFKTVKNTAPVYVIGVGTTVGGIIPEPIPPARPNIVSVDDFGDPIYAPPVIPEKKEPVHSVIDRSSLRKIASITGGEYFELDTESDSKIALKIINRVKNLKTGNNILKQNILQELYWHFIVVAGLFIILGIFFYR